MLVINNGGAIGSKLEPVSALLQEVRVCHRRIVRPLKT